MTPAEKAYYNAREDNAKRFSDDTLSRKPSSTRTQRQELAQRIAERRANGTLGKVPFVLEKVGQPFPSYFDADRWYVELTLSDGITRRVPAIPFDNEQEARGYAAEMTARIGQEVNQ